MPYDLSTLSPKARKDYLLMGRQFGSSDTLAQANQTLKGLAAHGAELVPHGFAEADAQRLTEVRDALVEAGVGRDDARAGKKITSAKYLSAVAAGKEVRASTRSILTGTRRALNEKSDPASEAAVKRLDAALQQTRSAGVDAGKLADQLDGLRTALEDATVAAEAATRGGPQAVADLLARAGEIRAAAAARAGAAGTPFETEYLDVLDGIVVTLTRDASKAARAAARRLGQPALAADFELTKLYDRKPASAAAPSAPEPGGAGAGAPPGAPEPPAVG